MDLIVRERDTLDLLAALPPHPTAGYLSLEVVRRLWQPDLVAVELDARVARDVGVAKGRLLVADGLVFVIEQVHITSTARAATLATVLGYDAATVPRAILPTPGQAHHAVISAPGETAIKTYVAANIGTGASALRRWPPLVIEPDGGRGEVGTWRARYQPLADYLAVIGAQTGIGYQTVWSNDDSPVFTAIVGTHRARLLSIAEGTVTAEESLSTDVDARNFGYVGGQGEGAARQIILRYLGGAEPVGLERREVFIDARDTDSIPTLQSRGDSKLAETAAPDTVELAIAERDGWSYGIDYALGDTLDYRNEFAPDRQVRIVEVASTWRESLVPTRTVTLDRPWPSPDEPASGGSEYL